MPFRSYGISALKAIGFPTAPGFESGILDGVTRNAFTIDPVHQMRSSSEATFLDHAITHGLPMTVYPMTQAMRIVFDKQKRATGVEVQSAGMNWTVSARNEVIVSAGVCHSPQLLMVSGIGPAETLNAHNITVVKDLPAVGQNMHDYCNIGGMTYNSSIKTPAVTTAVIEQYINNASGILTNSGGDVLGFEKLPAHLRKCMSNATLEQLAQWPADWPEVEYIPPPPVGRQGPRLRSDGMLSKPVISTNWLLEKADQEVAVQAYRRARVVWQQIPEAIKTSEEIFPGTNMTTDEQLLEAIRGIMGHANETMAVVDSHARVFGVERLRVIDSPSFRFTPPGHTQAATYAHAEKLVEDVMRNL
ncbi:hypothetical protein LTR85_006504 [Meristemomyces frigidus]|nr:hypothetical protein LTR85_006504 [Meristemomyces frigidus]